MQMSRYRGFEVVHNPPLPVFLRLFSRCVFFKSLGIGADD